MTFAAAVPGPHGQPLDQIRVDGVSATGHHGVLSHERAEGQEFRADVVLHLDTRAAASSDDLAATVSYAEVAQDVHDVLAGSPADLVETVAERIAAVVLARPAVQAVDVRVHKPQAPIGVPFDDVTIVVRRDRDHAPVVDAPAGAASEVGAPAVDVPVASPAPEPAIVAPVPVEAAAPAVVVTPEPEPVVDPLEQSPAEPVEAVLALGANLGDAQVTLREAVTDVDRIGGVQVTEVSPLARTAAVGPDQPDFLNAVLVVRTTLAPRALLHAVQQVEDDHGRVRAERWGPRTLDIDIVQYGSVTSTAADLELPHPRAHERAFVLVPWAEVDPGAQLGGLGGGPVGHLADTAPDRGGIRWLALDWLTGPTQSTGQIAAEDVAVPAPSAPVPQAAPAAPVAAPVVEPQTVHAPVPPAPFPAPAEVPPPEPDRHDVDRYEAERYEADRYEAERYAMGGVPAQVDPFAAYGAPHADEPSGEPVGEASDVRPAPDQELSDQQPQWPLPRRVAPPDDGRDG